VPPDWRDFNHSIAATAAPDRGTNIQLLVSGVAVPLNEARVPAVSPFPRAELHDYDVLADGETEAPSAVIVQLASSRSEKNGF
jgi:hypothetical protein